MFYIVGLGNPGIEYENSRHNTGRILVENFRKFQKFPEWENNKKAKGLVSEGKIKKEKVMLLLPETFMNKSGEPVAFFVKSKRSASELVVIYDDIDLPLGKIKISFNRGSGGHRGLESITKKIKTKEFIRLRIGISGKGAKGQAKKPRVASAKGYSVPKEEAVIKFILGKFRAGEVVELKKVSKRASEALLDIVLEGKEKAMGKWNSL